MIHTIYPRLNHPTAGETGKTLYHYDDPSVGVLCEPLLESTTTVIIDTLIAGRHINERKEAPEFISLHFTDNIDDATELAIIDTRKAPLLCLIYHRKADNCSVYEVECWYPEDIAAEVDMTACLCGTIYIDLSTHLMDYFPKTPDRFFMVLKICTQQ